MKLFVVLFLIGNTCSRLRYCRWVDAHCYCRHAGDCTYRIAVRFLFSRFLVVVFDVDFLGVDSLDLRGLKKVQRS
jgi:hypothetical protein